MTMQETKNLKMEVFELKESMQFTQSKQEENTDGVGKKL